MRHVSLLRIFLVSAVATAAVVVALNVAIDPYGYFGVGPLDGLSVRKPTALHHDRLLHASALRRNDVDCLLLGSSRVTEGIPRGHRLFAGCTRLYNGGLAGPSLREVRALFEHADGHHPLKHVWLGVDLFMFNAHRLPARGYAAELFEDRALPRLQHAASIAMSFDTLLDAVRTIKGQDDPVFFADGGFADPAFLALPLRQRSTRATFLRGVRGYIPHELPPPLYQFALRSADSQPLAEFARLLEEAHARDIDLTLFVNPAHAWQWELVAALGLWPAWEEWKGELVAINEQVATGAARRAFALTDFSGFQGFAVEDVPASATSAVAMSWFWDPSHYNATLGSLLLDRLAGASAPSGFGVPLDSTTIDAHLRTVRADAAHWRGSHAADVAAVSDIVRCFAPSSVLARLRLSAGDVRICRQLTELTR